MLKERVLKDREREKILKREREKENATKRECKNAAVLVVF